jgi:hypothetical protein
MNMPIEIEEEYLNVSAKELQLYLWTTLSEQLSIDSSLLLRLTNLQNKIPSTTLLLTNALCSLQQYL